MSNQNRLILQDLMESLLKRSGALVEPTGYGMLETVLPDELAEQFKDDHLLLAFDYEVAEETPEANLSLMAAVFWTLLLIWLWATGIIPVCSGRKSALLHPATWSSR